MIINFAVRIKTDGTVKLEQLTYYEVEPGKTFNQIAEITGLTIDAYTAAIERIFAATSPDPEQTVTNCNQSEAEQPPVTAAVVPPAAPPAPEPEPEPVKEEKPVTLEEVRKALIEVKKTKPEGLKACFDAVGTKSLSATDPSLYGALLAKAQEVLHA